MEQLKLKGVVAGAAAGAVGLLKTMTAAAQDVASAGNGGTATASANGGAVAIGDVNSGGNTGGAIGIGDTSGGDVSATGETSSNSTTLNLSADGGTAIADASGGDYNFAFVS